MVSGGSPFADGSGLAAALVCRDPGQQEVDLPCPDGQRSVFRVAWIAVYAVQPHLGLR